MTGMSIDHIEHVLNTYEQINCQSVFISFWYLGTSAYVPRGPRPLPQRFEVPTPHSEIRVSQYQVPMILRDIYISVPSAMYIDQSIQSVRRSIYPSALSQRDMFLIWVCHMVEFARRCPRYFNRGFVKNPQ